MKTKFSIVIVILVLISALALIVNAHPGNTDSSGGHYNKSTGEYHYHHGYPEHSHRDMDGDGKLDCPYDFHDKTGQNSGTSSGSGHSSSNKQPTVSSNSSRSFWNNLVDFFSSPYGIFCIIAVILQIIFALILAFVDFYGTLLLADFILFIASIKVSGPLVIACFMAYIGVVFLIYCILPMLLCIFTMIYNGIKWLLNFLFSQK